MLPGRTREWRVKRSEGSNTSKQAPLSVNSGEDLTRTVRGKQRSIDVSTDEEVIRGSRRSTSLLFCLDKVCKETTQGGPNAGLGRQVDPNDAEETRAFGAVPDVNSAKAAAEKRVGYLNLRGEGSPTLFDNDSDAASMLALGRLGSPVAEEGCGMAGLWAAFHTVAYALFAGEAPIKERFGENEEIWGLTGAVQGETEGSGEEGMYLCKAGGKATDVPGHHQQRGLGGVSRLGDGTGVQERGSVA